MLTDSGFDFISYCRISLQELGRIGLTLTNLISFVGIPGTGFLEDARVHAHVDDLAVLASARSKGVGAALLDACEGLARAAGQRWLRLGVLATNDRARAFYARQGYGELSLTLEKKL